MSKVWWLIHRSNKVAREEGLEGIEEACSPTELNEQKK